MSSSVKYIHASGVCDSGLMVIGEAPGEEEDKQGRPFVGRSGQLLDKMLAHIGLNRGNVYVTNIVKVRPDGNRTPTPEEIDSWLPVLTSEIAEIKPRAILLLGASASKRLLNQEVGISKYRGSILILPGTNIPTVATFHPSYLLRKSSDVTVKEVAKADLALVKSLL